MNSTSKINIAASLKQKDLSPKSRSESQKQVKIYQNTTLDKSNHTNGCRTKTLNLLLVEPSLHAK